MSVSEASAILLAGGRSSRMGTDKALLKLSTSPLPQTLLERTYECLQHAGLNDIHISRNCALEGFSTIADKVQQRGPLAGIEACLPYCKYQRVLVVPVDQPRLSVALLHQLLAAQGDCVMFENNPLPCVIPNTGETKALLHQWLSDPNEHCSVARFLKALSVQERACRTPQALMNTNTPQEWRAYEQSQ
ncbi:molybdenum cofactor guanylyltransferase [Aliidiomarina celeris]|uniref:molybdenum cofactor guanylyltransferase n=1 Tax=Aliidiomarina celeris TaxID=2249428 RepID=UPI000DEAE6A8|nr:molybdenum cofactor guanylyltransferase [Aliidiomarina celeris]